MKLTIINVRKALVNNQIVLSKFVQDKMLQVGYSKRDVIKCIWTAEITDVQVHKGILKVILEGLDAHDNPIVCVIGKNHKNHKQLKIYNLFPPTNESYRRVI
ncbi:hypothetical protein [Lysinibacillus sp. OL1]|uniref:hypothetical protein n=1 Tax=Lysinibacillus sp. OL1 TaxID=2517243 RepID=UPI001039135E|nr:hypothetical protein [Lysinibacillus sp. OL1]TBV85436.1 hypothetical protein EW028_21015 [Lysinibacillus sp. OL1]